jgi:hypothetical protein
MRYKLLSTPEAPPAPYARNYLSWQNLFTGKAGLGQHPEVQPCLPEAVSITTMTSGINLDNLQRISILLSSRKYKHVFLFI